MFAYVHSRMIVNIGIHDMNHDETTLDVYVPNFETPLLDASRAFYRREAHVALQKPLLTQPTAGEDTEMTDAVEDVATMDVQQLTRVREYMKRVEGRITEEEGRVSLYLHGSTLKPVQPP